MQNNVRNFVTAVLVLALSGYVHAMGFGGLDVQSNLGEPFKARVKLSDVSPDVGAECFKLVRSDASVPFASSIHIDHGAENSATLIIQGHKPVDEPILNLSLIATCSQELNREYVVLLDPPAYNNEVNLPEVVSGNTNVPDAHNKDSNPKAHHSAQPTTDEVSAAGSTNTPKKVKRKKKAKSPASSVRTDDAQPMYPQTIPVEPAVREETNYAKPSKEVATPTTSDAKLYISGATGEGIGPIALRLERTLSETPPSEDAPVDLTDEDVSDEVTAMTKQLSHLQSQIAALQKRNEELEKSSQEKIAKKPKDEEESASRWMLYSLITLAVLAAIAVAEWVRRRKQRLELESSEITPWVPDEISPTPNNTEAKLVANAVVEKSVANYTPPPSPVETEINDDILEQVEVFVAHGRANLAITLLQEYLRENPSRSPAAWLTLLDLFKREKMRTEYEEAASECKRLFNVNVSTFDDPNETDNSRIDDYPEAKEQLEEVWGTPDELNKLNELAYNKRKEPREGFDKNAYLDVLLLRGIAQHRTQGDSSSTAHDDVTYTDDDRLFADDEIKPVDVSDFPDLEVIDPETLTGTPLVDESSTLPTEGSAEPKPVSNEIEFEMPNLDLPDSTAAKPASSPQSIIENAKNEIVKDAEEAPKLDKSAPLDFKL